MISEVKLRIFGRMCHLVIDNSDERGAERLSQCQAELARLDSKFSPYHPKSITSQINQGAGTGSAVPLDPEAVSLFSYIDALWDESNHLFDPTVRILRDCYDSDGKLHASTEQLQGMLKLVGWNKIDISAAGAHMSQRGMLLDMNACIRPYALDSIARKLRAQGVKSAYLELGEDVICIGKQSDGANWLAGARIPQGNRTGILRLKVNDRGFALRGNIEQTSVQNGEYFGRVLSPVDGIAIPGLLSVAVIADNCLTACSAASIARVKTEASGLKWLEKLGMPWLAVDRQFNCHGPLAQR